MKTFYMPYNRCAGGQFIHYHHFLFGYLLPTINVIDFSGVSNCYIKSCGNMDSIVTELGINILPDVPDFNMDEYVKIFVESFDGPNRKLHTNTINHIVYKLATKFNTESKISNTDNYILLIDRGINVTGDVNIKQRGSLRRSIINMDDLQRTLADFAPVKRIVLEHCTFQEQFDLFYNAHTVVAQHGAGISNLIFSKRCKNFIQFVSPKDKHKNRQQIWFKTLSAIKCDNAITISKPCYFDNIVNDSHIKINLDNVKYLIGDYFN